MLLKLTPSERSALKARAHSLRPVVAIGTEGLSGTVLKEIDRSLRAHQLIKVRTHGVERQVREAMMTDICVALDATPVQHIGKILVIFRDSPEREAEAAPAGEREAPPRRGPTG